MGSSVSHHGRINWQHGSYATAMSEELESAHAIAVQNVFAGRRLVAAQKARISALKAAGLATNGHERLLEIMERRLRLLEEDERKLRLAHVRDADVSAKL